MWVLFNILLDKPAILAKFTGNPVVSASFFGRLYCGYRLHNSLQFVEEVVHIYSKLALISPRQGNWTSLCFSLCKCIVVRKCRHLVNCPVKLYNQICTLLATLKVNILYASWWVLRFAILRLERGNIKLLVCKLLT